MERTRSVSRYGYGSPRVAIGEKLPNGTILIARRELERHEIVLAMDIYPNERVTYITWRVYHQDDNTTSEGHYHPDDFAAAAADFIARN